MEDLVVVKPGATLGQGHWTIIDQVGSGGTALVYRAQNAHGKVVAVKVLRPERQISEAALAAFHAEARLRQQTHNDVLEIDRAFFVMHFYKGTPLRARLDEEIAKTGRYATAEAWEVFRQIADQLARLHPDVVLRDLKPENVMLEARHRGYDVTLIDHGAAFSAIANASPACAGTARYEAPECYDPDRVYPVTSAADIYALGVMLFEASVGVPPFRAATPDEIRALHLEGDLKPERLDQHRCPAPLANLILRCLDLNPRQRPGAREVSDVLRQLAVVPESVELQAPGSGSGPVDVLRVEPSNRTAAHPEPARRQRWRYAAALIALVLLAIGFVTLRQRTFRTASGTAAVRPPLSETEISRECSAFNGTEYVCIPAGEFQMGLKRSEVDQLCDRLGADCTRTKDGVYGKLLRAVPEGEAPRRTWLSTFGLMRFPVTCAAFAAHLNRHRQDVDFDVEPEKEPYQPADGPPVRRLRYPRRAGKRIYDLFSGSPCIARDEATKEFRVATGLENRPIERVPWFEAAAYCIEDGANLPSEAQYEKVRRASGAVYPWGSSVDPSCTMVAYGQLGDNNVQPRQRGECEALDPSLKGVHDVGWSSIDVVPPFGIHDLGGNVREWALDGFTEHLQPCPGGLCVNPVVPPQPSNAFLMIGGSYAHGRWFMFSTFRGQYRGDAIENTSGFRCARTTTSGVRP